MIDDNRYIAKFLKEARQLAKLTAGEASEELAKLGISLTGTTINGYENNRSKPDAEKFLALCKIYGVSNPIPLIQEIRFKDEESSKQSVWNKANNDSYNLSKVTLNRSENELLQNFRDLSSENKGIVKSLIKKLKESQLYRRDKRIIEPINIISHPVFLIPASAGTGEFLDSDNYELVDFPEDSVPRDSNFAVRVSGNSMEPDYPDKSIVFVKKVKTLEPGEIGIFILNGEGFLKVLGESNNLVSLNPDYKDIQISQYDNCKIVGKVVGTYNE